MTDAEILETALAWVADDPDPESRAAAQALIDRGDQSALREHFAGRLQFGTAGMRGALGPGPLRMNRAMVRRVSAGFADYVLDEVPGAASPTWSSCGLPPYSVDPVPTQECVGHQNGR